MGLQPTYKKHEQLLVTLAAINKVQGNTEEVVSSQVTPYTKHTRTRTEVTRGMVKEWNMMARKGMTHREIIAMYGVSLVTVDRHLARKSGKKVAKVKKASVSPTLLMIDREVEI